MSESISENTDQHVLHTYARAPFILERGEGMYLYDTEGNSYLDFVSGISVMALGHSDPEITQVVAEQVGKLSHVSNLYHTAAYSELADQLCASSFADKVYFANSGTEAVEAAIKFARKYALETYGPGKTGIVAFRGAFHGRTAGSLAMTPKEKYQGPFRPLMPGVEFAPFNDLEAAEKLIGPQTCAVFLEPVQGEGGIHVATPEFLQGLRAACDRHGAALIFDEIQSGMGRTGTLWAHEPSGVSPDMMTAAKALGGGLPIGVTLLTDKIASVMHPGDHGSTFAGGSVVCRAAQVMLKRVNDPAMLAHVNAMGALLKERLMGLESSHILEIRGRGLMIGVQLDIPAAPLIEAGYQHGLLLLNAGPDVLRLLPPLIVNETHIAQLVTALTAILDEVDA